MEHDRSPFIHPSALVETDRIGAGSRIWAFAHVLANVTIGSDCNIGDHCFIEGNVTIGNGVTVKNGVSIWEHVQIADNVFLGPNVALTNDRFPRSRSKDWKPVPTWLDEGASIGANATIICGVRLGARCLVGAGSVVTRDVPPNALVFGNPAEVKGWVCHCAQLLDLDAGGSATCASCGRKYTLTDSGIQPL